VSPFEDAGLDRSALYESLVRALSDLGEGVTIYEAGSQHAVYVNEASVAITGYSKEEMREMNLADMVVDEQKQELVDRQQARYRGDRVPDHYEVTIERKDGTRVDIETAIKPIELEGRQLFLALFRDVSEGNRARDYKAALEKSELRHRQALEINDNLVQGLAVAKYAMELGDSERATQAIENTLHSAQGIVGSLLDQSTESGASSLLRQEPASVEGEGES
jgi:PAS domain S-box-containing protein